MLMLSHRNVYKRLLEKEVKDAFLTAMRIHAPYDDGFLVSCGMFDVNVRITGDSKAVVDICENPRMKTKDAYWKYVDLGHTTEINGYFYRPDTSNNLRKIHRYMVGYNEHHRPMYTWYYEYYDESPWAYYPRRQRRVVADSETYSEAKNRGIFHVKESTHAVKPTHFVRKVFYALCDIMSSLHPKDSPLQFVHGVDHWDHAAISGRYGGRSYSVSRGSKKGFWSRHVRRDYKNDRSYETAGFSGYNGPQSEFAAFKRFGTFIGPHRREGSAITDGLHTVDRLNPSIGAKADHRMPYVLNPEKSLNPFKYDIHND